MAEHAAAEGADGLEQQLTRLERGLATARSALAAEAVRRRELSDLVPIALLTTTVDGIVREANRAASELFGVPLHYLPGKPVMRYIDDPAVRPRRLAGLDTQPTPMTLTVRPRHRDPVEMHALVARSRSRGDASELLWALWDPSSDTAPSPAVVYAVVGRGERRARAESLANAAHELQTPITAILSAADVLEAGAKEIPDDRDRFLGHIRWETMRLARLVWAMLALERARSGHAPPLEIVPLAPLLDEIAVALVPAPNVVVSVECEPGVGVWAERNLLEQAIANLAVNAAKFTKGGTIVIRGKATPEGQVRIDVVDSGAGISSADAERVFAPFVRAGPDSTPGFGLGLAIVREAVEALGGVVTLAPGDVAGTVATILLPGRAVTA